MLSWRSLLILCVGCGLLASVALAAITLRSEKGSELTITEFDTNFTDLQTWVYTPSTGLAWTLPATSSVQATVVTVPAIAGARYPALTFTDDAGDMVYATMLRAPVGWTSGTLRVVGSGTDQSADPTGHALGFQVDAQCRSHNSALSDVWGTAQLLTIAFTTTDRLQSTQTAAITPGGTCTGGTAGAPVYVNVRVRVNPGTFACAPTPTNCLLLNLDVVFTRP
jgi:hypothetical protein